jgi:hypothetical protein
MRVIERQMLADSTQAPGAEVHNGAKSSCSAAKVEFANVVVVHEIGGFAG